VIYACTMVLLLDGQTSMDFWRVVYPENRELLKPPCSAPNPPYAVSAENAWLLAPSWLTTEYLDRGAHVLGVLTSGGRCARRHSQTHKAHSWSKGFPSGSFYDLENGVFVSSPCFIFLQMASVLSLPELVAYGDELCGLYAFDRSAERGIRKRKHPLITKAQLASFLESAKGHRGSKCAQLALTYIVEKSASPMETLDEILLCFPYRYGGYAIRVASMNNEVPLNLSARRIAGLQRCYTDISWPPIKYDIEHQGKRDHMGEADFEADRARINALRIMGFEVIELTHSQVSNWRSFEEIALHTAKILGHRVPIEKRGLTAKRKLLRKTLYGWNRSYGHKHHDL